MYSQQEQQEQQDRTDDPWRALWELSDGQRLRYGGAVVAMFVSIAFTFVVPLVIKWCIDGIVAGEYPGGDTFPWLANLTDNAVLLGAAGVVILATGLGGVFIYLRGRWAAIASQAITQRLREQLFTHLEHLPSAFHDKAETGDLIQRCTSDVETVRTFLAAQVVEVGRTLIMVTTVAPVLFWLDWRLALVSLCLMPFIFFFAFRFFGRVQSLFQARDEAEAALSARLQENLTGIRVVRAFARQDFEIDRFAECNQAFRDNDQKLNLVMAAYWSISDLLTMAQMGIVLIVGAWWVTTGDIGVGTLFAFYTYVGMLVWPIRQLARVLQDVGKAIVALGRLDHILGEPEESAHEAAPAQALGSTIEINHLSFGFKPDDPVLRDISLTIPRGEVLALLGPPGCGKTALVQLLMRLYDYETGSIRIDGHELADLPRKLVRSHIGVVMQEPFLYSRSIRENLRVGKRDATDAEIDAATRDAAIADSIDRFASGFDALVGERGVTLSGGQRQRLALARALVRDPPILILDDALSAVDTGTEQQILDALTRRHGKATTIMIAHRLSTVVGADRIAVMDAGRIVQLGSHAELIRMDGPYRRLCSLQATFEESLDRDLERAEVEETP